MAHLKTHFRFKDLLSLSFCFVAARVHEAHARARERWQKSNASKRADSLLKNGVGHLF